MVRAAGFEPANRGFSTLSVLPLVASFVSFIATRRYSLDQASQGLFCIKRQRMTKKTVPFCVGAANCVGTVSETEMGQFCVGLCQDGGGGGGASSAVGRS